MFRSSCVVVNVHGVNLTPWILLSLYVSFTHITQRAVIGLGCASDALFFSVHTHKLLPYHFIENTVYRSDQNKIGSRWAT